MGWRDDDDDAVDGNSEGEDENDVVGRGVVNWYSWKRTTN